MNSPRSVGDCLFEKHLTLRRAWGCWKIAITALVVVADDDAVGVVVVLAADGAAVVVEIHESAAAFLAVT